MQAVTSALNACTEKPVEKPVEKWAKEKAARKAGKIIQFRILAEPGSDWEDLHPMLGPSWSAPYEYRIKPEPEWTPRFEVGDRVKTPEKSGDVIKEIHKHRPAYWFYGGYFWDEADLEPLPDPQREAFEKWWSGELGMSISRYTDGELAKEYAMPESRTAYLAWQAASKQPARS